MLLERLSPFGGLAPGGPGRPTTPSSWNCGPRRAARAGPDGRCARRAADGYPWLVDAAGLSTRPALAVSGLVTDAGVHNRPRLCGLLAVLAPRDDGRDSGGDHRAGSARPGVHRTGLGKTVWISFPTA